MPARAFAPAHLTGIFKIYKNSSAGAGLTLQHGMHTIVSTGHSHKPIVFINGRVSSAPVSNWVIRKFSKWLGDVPIQVCHSTPLPIGCGFGLSAAGALSLALALNEWCSSPLSKGECTKIAHDADVACGTGLASVDVQAIGGLVSRKGAFGRPDVKKFTPSELRTPIKLAVFGRMRTSSIIRSKKWKEKIQKAGTEALLQFYNHRCMNSLANASNLFAIKSGLGKWAQEILESNKNIGMAMLGKALFFLGEDLDFPDLQKHGQMRIFITYPTNRKAQLE